MNFTFVFTGVKYLVTFFGAIFFTHGFAYLAAFKGKRHLNSPDLHVRQAVELAVSNS